MATNQAWTSSTRMRCVSPATPLEAPTQVFIAGAVKRGKTSRDALRIVKRRLARLVWTTMMRDIAAAP